MREFERLMQAAKPVIPNFSASEFACKCGDEHCHIFPIDQRKTQNLLTVASMLQCVRTVWKCPITILSAYRCGQHPIEVAKARPGSHNSCQAVDIYAPNALKARTASEVWDASCVRIGLKSGIGNYPGKKSMHLDIGHPLMARPARWTN